MRVIAGTARSIPLVSPEGEEITRPTQDKIKETLFNIIQNEVPGCVFLDLCAGSGAIGIEAVSRGARRSYLVERDRKALACIETNVHKTHLEDQIIILKTDVLNAIRNIHEKQAGVIYIDPPYQSGLEQPILQELSRAPYVTEDTLLIVEAALDTDFDFVSDLGLEVTRVKGYRSQKHVFIRKTVPISTSEENAR